MQQMLQHSDPPLGRPGCWGRPDIYDSEDKECRGCGFQNTCRNQVIKLTPNQQMAPVQTTAPYYPYQPAPYTAPQSAMPAPVPAPVQIARYQPAPMPAPIAPPTYMAPVKVPAPLPTVQPQYSQQGFPAQQDWYGRMQDPLFFSVLSPPPFRPQMLGETFPERVFKNLLLDVTALAFGHLMLGLRQMILPPQPQDKSNER